MAKGGEQKWALSEEHVLALHAAHCHHSNKAKYAAHMYIHAVRVAGKLNRL
jgi:hypothetical protein